MKKLLLLFLLLTAACASWNQIGSSSESTSYNFSIESPEHCTKLNTHKYLIYTKDNPFSQYILVQQRHVDTPFRNTKKRIKKGMIPQEAAEIILDEITCDRSVLNFLVLESVPATVNRYDGFKILFTYKNKNGLKFKTVYYGFLQGEWFYSIRYNADEMHYCQEDIRALRKVLSSFKIMDAGSLSFKLSLSTLG